jgi:hypothetical protein
MRHRIESNGTDDAIQGFNACTAVYPSDFNNVATGEVDEVIEKRRNTKRGDAAPFPREYSNALQGLHVSPFPLNCQLQSPN